MPDGCYREAGSMRIWPLQDIQDIIIIKDVLAEPGQTPRPHR